MATLFAIWGFFGCKCTSFDARLGCRYQQMPATLIASSS